MDFEKIYEYDILFVLKKNLYHAFQFWRRASKKKK